MHYKYWVFTFVLKKICMCCALCVCFVCVCVCVCVCECVCVCVSLCVTTTLFLDTPTSPLSFVSVLTQEKNSIPNSSIDDHILTNQLLASHATHVQQSPHNDHTHTHTHTHNTGSCVYTWKSFQRWVTTSNFLSETLSGGVVCQINPLWIRFAHFYFALGWSNHCFHLVDALHSFPVLVHINCIHLLCSTSMCIMCVCVSLAVSLCVCLSALLTLLWWSLPL